MTSVQGARRSSAPSNRAERSELRRAQVLGAALDCFIERGYNESTMEDIRRRSGVSIGSIYHHFGSKQELAVALHLQYWQRWWARSEPVLRTSATPSAVIRAFVSEYLSFVQQEPGLIRFMYFLPESLQIRSVARVELAEEWSRGQQTLWSWLQTTAEAGAIRTLPMDLYHAVIFGPMLEHAGRWLRGVTETPLDDAAPLLGETIWRSLQR